MRAARVILSPVSLAGVATVALVVLAALGLAPWWSTPIPAGALVVVTCATGWVIARRRTRAYRTRLLLADMERRVAKAERRARSAGRKAR